MKRRPSQRSSFKRRLRRFAQSTAAIVVLAVALIWVVVAAGTEWTRNRRIAQEIQAVQQEIERVEQQSSQLQRALDAFSRPATVELEARRRLNLARPDEHLVVIPDDEAQESAAFPSETTERTPEAEEAGVVTRQGTGPLANLLAWWGYFFVQP